MIRNILFTLIIALNCLSATGQTDAEYIRTNAVRIDNPEKLNDSVYNLLSSFQIIMFGEMHGTNESAPFVNGLANLLTGKGDSVQVGLEIPSTFMKQFISQHTDSSIYASDFFLKPPYESGKESVAWATLISKLKDNSEVQLFFFDVNPNEGKPYQRDSLMYSKIKMHFMQHPAWRMITLSGNFHNRISDATTMISYLIRDKELKLNSKICSLNMEYLKGTCRANFGHGLEVKELGHRETIYDTAVGFDNYLILLSSKSDYEYTGFYYTKYITAAKMANLK